VFTIKNDLKKGDALSPLLSNLVLEYAIRRIYEKHEGLKLNGTHWLLVFDDDVNIYWAEAYIIQRKKTFSSW
jgi:hypothetical protein